MSANSKFSQILIIWECFYCAFIFFLKIVLLNIRFLVDSFFSFSTLSILFTVFWLPLLATVNNVQNISPLFIPSPLFSLSLCRSKFLTYIIFLFFFFNSSCKLGLLMTKFLNFRFSEEVFISVSLLKDNFTEQNSRLVVVFFFSFKVFNIFLHSLFACMVLRSLM